MLYIVATPIGNLEDITLRALRVLKEVDFVLCEDTRNTGLLLAHFDIKRPLVSFFEYNEIKKIPWVVEELKKGKNFALASDGGTPTISDPGYKLVRECRVQGLPVTSLPGASSIINALALTSLAHDKFFFAGYIPRKPGERTRLFENIKVSGFNTVFLESPYRVAKSLQAMREFFGNIRVAIAREMTKHFEEVLELTLEEAINHFKEQKPRGEFTIIIESRDF